MKLNFLTALILLLALPLALAADDREDMYRYELESFEGNMPVQAGSCIVKVWSYGKKEKVTRNECMKNAVHGILFKGYAKSSRRSADHGRKALVPEGYEAHKKYFDAFFDDGDYLQYVQLTNNGRLMAGDVIKIGKREYKVGMVVIINHDALRKRLEKDKIIKALDSLF